MSTSISMIEACAIVWAEAIHDHPSFWIDTAEIAMLRAIKDAYPDTKMMGEDCTCGSGACGSSYKNWWPE